MWLDIDGELLKDPLDDFGPEFHQNCDFTIRGITKSVTFDAKVEDNNGKLSIAGSVVLDRAQFEVKYGSGSFFDNLGDNLIHDSFTVGFNLVANAS